MLLMAVGVDHVVSPVAVREQLALTASRLDDALARLRARVGEGFVLSTCNRTEVYAVVGHVESGARLLTDFLAECGGQEAAELAPHVSVRAHDAAVAHLFGVAAGLNSMVLGEDQILAQLKAALARARAMRTLGPALHRLGAAALAVGKRVRTDTGISRHALSVVSVALDEASARMSSLADRRVLVVGAGHTAELTLKHLSHLRGGGRARCTVISRGTARAAELAARHGSAAVTWDDMEQALVHADLVVSCTSAPGFVIPASAIARVQQLRRAASLVMLDLAVPRDIEPAVDEVPGVTLFAIDSLEATCRTNRALRASEIALAESIVEEHTARYVAWLSARQVTPTISALVARATEIRDAEVERTLARLPGLSGREQALTRAMATRIVNKLMHAPLRALKEHPEAGNLAAALHELFGLGAQHTAGFAEGAPVCPIGRAIRGNHEGGIDGTASRMHDAQPLAAARAEPRVT